MSAARIAPADITEERVVTMPTFDRRWRSICTAALAVAAAWGSAERADAAIYWTYNSVAPTGSHEVRGHIGRANLNGRHVNPRFITLKRHILPWGVAVDRRHLYWTAISAPPVGIGRANLDGSGVDQGFTPVLWNDDRTASEAHFGITVAGGHIYWANPGPGTIGRSDLDGTNVNQEFIPLILGACRPSAVAVGGGYVFWSCEGGNTIGRANLDGSDPNPAFIVGAHVPDGIAVAGGYVYWSNIPGHGDTIGRATINGTRVNHRFLRHTTALALATKGKYIYGSNFDHIWRARLDGSHLKRRFIKVKGGPDGLAVR
jgi:virginiamycin B lyase